MTIAAYSIGARIREARKHANLSQEKLAEITGVTRPAVSQWEHNQTTPDYETLAKIAKATGVRLEWLVLHSGGMQDENEAYDDQIVRSAGYDGFWDDEIAIGSRVFLAIRAAGIKSNDVERETGLTVKQIQELIFGKAALPSEETLRRIAQRTNVPYDFLRYGDDNVPWHYDLQGIRANASGMLSPTVRDLPILGHWSDDRKKFQIDPARPVGFISRPYFLVGVPGSYAIEFWDSTTEPIFKRGSLGWVNPHKNVADGAPVVVRLKDGSAYVATVTQRAAVPMLQQHLPSTFKFRLLDGSQELEVRAEMVLGWDTIVGSLIYPL